MFEARVAQFYRAKGYQVHENPKVRGASESIYTAALVADGPLGALLISFGDAGGIDGPEIGRVRTMARDVGATPVVAAPELTPDLRRLAAQLGVVVVDEATVSDTGPLPRDLPAVGAKDPIRRDLDAHPWPASGRAFSYAGNTAAAARDVDDLIADLHRPQPAPPPAGAPAPLLAQLRAPAPEAATPPTMPAQSSAQVLAPPVPMTQAPIATPAPPVVRSQGGKFSWLTTEPTVAAPAPQLAGPVDLSALLAARPTPAAPPPAVEHESALTARTPMLERAQGVAYTSVDTMRDWPWKTIIWATIGGALLIAFIHWLA